jgi:hypothetical protein
MAEAKEKFGSEIDLGTAGVNAQYWTVDLRSAYNMTVPAPSPDVGTCQTISMRNAIC